jgi:hypothetical protein
VARVWYCANCGYEVASRGRCHSCREKLTLSALPELRPGATDEEVGYRIEGWTDRDRGRLIVELNNLGVEHRFEDDELVIDAADEDRVDDLVASLGAAAEEGRRDEPAGGGDVPPTGGDAPAGSSAQDLLDDSPGGDTRHDPADRDGPEDLPGDDAPDDSSGTAASDERDYPLRLLAAAAARLREDPTDMQADADVAEASTAVFIEDSHPAFGADAWSAIGRTTRRLLAALGADEALEDDIRREAGVLVKLLGNDADGPSADAVEGDQTVYELDDWLPDQRAQLGFLLEQRGIAYRWEGDELLVPSDSEEQVEQLFDLVGGGAGDDDEDDEDRYQALTELFAACGRLAGDPTDESRREQVLEWIDASDGPPLLGLDELDWFRLRTHCRVLSGLLEADGDLAEVHREAGELHELLRKFV